MQMPRELRRGGGIMNVVPRQGALFGGIKKAVKGVAKGIGSALKSDLGKAALLGVGAFGIPGTSFGGLLGRGEGSFLSNLFSGKATGLKELLGGEKTLGKTLGIAAAGTVLGGVLGAMSPEEQEEVSSGRNVSALRGKLTTAYQNLGYDESKIPALVDNDLSEYTSGAGGYANGGRIGYAGGTPRIRNVNTMSRSSLTKALNAMEIPETDSRDFDDNQIRELLIKFAPDLYTSGYANGGRIGYALGTPEQNAIEAAGIMNLPLNQNPAGVTELDLRETGGFIPPVGVKEKADDIPAMLANNEFVFTADAVRGMGDGNVNKGAQRMYDMMKKLEKGGRV